MTRHALVAAAMAGWLTGLGPDAPVGPAGAPTPVEANGVTQREVRGRVDSVDAAAGTLVVTSEFRGKTTRLTLKAPPGMRVFTCADERAGLDRVKTGMVVSVFYEVVGADGVVNLIVVEPAR